MSKPESAAVDDADLEDLLDHKTDGTEETPLDLDHLTKGQLDVPRRRSSSPGLGSLVSAHCRYLCYMYPRCCGCVSVGTVALVMFFLIGLILDPKDTYGVIKNDYTNIQSEYDLSLGKIDHWCLKGDDMSCRCEDPLEPQSRMEFKTWVNAHNENKKSVEAYVDSEMVDVAFIGESIVEEMDGRWMGRAQGDDLKGIEKSFKRQFKRTKSGFEGVALGIAGDTSPNVLWRLLHGEMPADFNPRVWWVMLGMNDLGRMQCSEEVVVLGILRVVEEIRTRKPDAKIVINSMLPMADLRGGAFPTLVEYKDAIVQRNKNMRGFSKTTNPDLFARGPDGVAGTVSAAKPVEYERPESTTKALRYRRKKQYRKYPKMKKENEEGGNTEKKADDRRERLHRLLETKRNLKKRRDEDEEEGETSGVGTSDKKELTKEQIAALGAFLKKIRKDPVNPKLSVDKSVVRRRDPKRLFMAKNRLPLFKSIFAINSQLRRFADKHDDISFFDATKIFTERGENGKYVLQSEKISIRGHPTLVGFEKLEEAMALKLKRMFEKEDLELKVEAEAAEEEEKEEDEAKEKEQKIEKKKIEDSEEDDPDEKEEASGIEKKTDDKADASKEDEKEKSDDKDTNSEKGDEPKEEKSKEEKSKEEKSEEEESKKEESKKEESKEEEDEEEDEESDGEEESEEESEESEDE